MSTVSRPLAASPWLAPLLAPLLAGCVLTGIEPDEIDVADDETGAEGGLSTGLGEAGGDGDGDAAEGGDTDGDPGTSGGDGDDTGSETTGSGGDGDGDPSDEPSCSAFGPSDLIVGDNPVAIAEGSSALLPSCGGLGPETVYRFVAPSDGDWSFVATSAELVPVLALVSSCEPLTELACATADEAAVQPLVAGEVVYVVLDSDTGAGAATVSISTP